MATAVAAVAGSHASTDSRDLEDMKTEIQEIEEGSSSSNDETADEDLSKTPDEGEQELSWLQDAGFSSLVSKFEEGRELAEDVLKRETSSLTKAQAAAVRKRVDTLNATIRKRQKQKQQQKKDVRNVFSDSQDPEEKRVSNDQPSKPTRPSKTRERSFMKSKGNYSMSVAHGDSSDQVETLRIDRARGEGDIPVNFDVADSEDSPEPHSPPNRRRSGWSKEDGLPADEDVLNLKPKLDHLGITHVHDLSKQDITKVRELALIELTSIFDIHNIIYTRRKPKRRFNITDHGIYGVPLHSLLEHDQKRHPKLLVPLFVKQLIEYLEKCGIEEEGILRVSGLVTRIKSLRKEIEEKFNSGQFRWEDVRPHDAAGLLKQFLRDLPAPLLTYEYLDAFAQVEQIPGKQEQVQALMWLITLLPDAHRNVLQILLRYLKRVVDNEGNKMTSNNVSMIMAPNLFLAPRSTRHHRRKTDHPGLELAMFASTAQIIKMMIKYEEIIWIVPPFILRQIRERNDAEQLKKARDKSIMKFLGRRDKSDVYKRLNIQRENDFKNGIIQVKAPRVSKSCVSVRLDASSTARDVLSNYQHTVQLQGTKPPEHNGRRNSSGDELENSPFDLTGSSTFLFEVGGNIGERRLDPRTNIMEVYRVNPNAEWVIRS